MAKFKGLGPNAQHPTEPGKDRRIALAPLVRGGRLDNLGMGAIAALPRLSDGQNEAPGL